MAMPRSGKQDAEDAPLAMRSEVRKVEVLKAQSPPRQSSTKKVKPISAPLPSTTAAPMATVASGTPSRERGFAGPPATVVRANAMHDKAPIGLMAQPPVSHASRP